MYNKIKNNNIHPVFDRMLNRSDKEKLLNQRSKVIWITGLSGSGKSTIASGLEYKLHKQGYLIQVLDGDNIRKGINNNLGFSEEDRKENIRRIAEIAKLSINNGIITICCFISPTEEIRNQVKEIVGKNNFFIVYVNTPLKVCEERDIKGLYKKARQGIIKNFTGIDSPYEAPVNPFFEIKTSELSINETVDNLYKKILPKLKYR